MRSRLLLVVLLVSCTRTEPPVSDTTRTHPVRGVERTGGATAANEAGCLDRANEIVNQGEPCIRGTWDVHSETIERSSNHQTRHLVSPLAVRFAAWAVRQGELRGSAHLRYSVRGTETNTEAKGCKVSTAITDPIEWDVKLNGYYLAASDGS